MHRLTIFNEEFSLSWEPESDKAFDLALEISSYLQGKIESVSDDAKKLLEIEQNPVFSRFFKLMLITDKPGVDAIEYIHMATGLDKELISVYKELFFDTSRLMGELGKTAFYIELQRNNPIGSEEYEFGKMLEEAHIGGPDVVLDNFNIDTNGYDDNAYRRFAAKRAMYDYKMLRRTGDYETFSNRMNANNAIITTIDKSVPKSADSAKNDIQRLVSVIEEISKQGAISNDVDVPVFDPAHEEIIEVPANSVEDLGEYIALEHKEEEDEQPEEKEEEKE